MANTAKKAAALRKADAAVARRAEEFHRREKALREIIADYFYATDHAEKTRADAQAKADQLTSHTETRIAQIRDQAEHEASTFEQQAHTAMRRMLELGETRDSVADLTGLSTAQVRAFQRTAPALRAPQRAAPDTAQPPGAVTSTVPNAR